MSETKKQETVGEEPAVSPDIGMIHPFDGAEVDMMLALAYLIEKMVDENEQT